MQKLVSILLSVLLAGTPVAAQQSAQTVDHSMPEGAFWNFGIYRARLVPEADLSDSTRLDQLIRGGKLYLSLADAIALALENNLDIQVARYSPLEAQADLLRAKAGANLSGVQTQISTLSTAQSAQGGGGGGGAGFTTGPSGQATGVTQGASAAAQGGAGNAASFFGTQTINLDPQLSSTVTVARSSNPQISPFVTGTNTLVSDIGSTSFNYSQGFISGTTFGARLSTFRQKNNNIRNSFNPTTTSDFSLFFTQRLLQGFGPAVNSRNIRIAKNNQEIEDLNFETQVITTISQLETLYWDLVTFRRLAEARRLDLELTERLVRQTRKQAELGLQARVEITRTEAEATTFRQQLVQAETSVREQEEILKNALTKHGPTSAMLAGVEIIPTDSIRLPEQEAVEPVQDLIEEALRARPELSRTRMDLTNSDISLRGIKNALKPSVDVTAFATNNGLAGTLNPDVALLPGEQVNLPDEFFIGGVGTSLGQVLRRNFPDYGVQFQLNIPLKNRTAQADMTRELLRRRRSDIVLRQQENSVKLEVARALASLEQTRGTFRISVEARELREEMVEAEEKRFSLGQSTIFQIIQAQRDLSTARTSEINAESSYEAARNQLERVVGRTLSANNVSIDEAYAGVVSKPADPIPPTAN